MSLINVNHFVFCLSKKTHSKQPLIELNDYIVSSSGRQRNNFTKISAIVESN